MAYDLAILDKSGKPSKTVAISVDDHFTLIQFARSHNLSLLQRMHDYYRDTDYTAGEVFALLTEIEDAQGQADIKIKSILSNIIPLIKEATSNNAAIVGISD